MAWIYLTIAGLLEVVWAIGLRYTEGFSRPLPSLFTLAAMGGSFWLLSIALKTLPIGTAYGVWVGIGAVGTAIAGVLILGEPASWAKFLCILLIVAGIAGLKLTSPS
ncbi:quaternary ammonium compound efflux SMR transporter SugE [Indioceanicola profundi]|uniref:quaternary ammonium compound efflux SMR transporter SugE n=1 Tax=Indioceanicola profundi TaxID=2220096 RepID=UPI000E6AAE99|nr:quaternary ammonium compound efflux SMR transporter SugE [Indioceanicola profundi]